MPEEEEEEEGGLSLEGERQREEGRLFIKAVNPMQMEKRRRWVRIEKLRGGGLLLPPPGPPPPGPPPPGPSPQGHPHRCCRHH